MNNEQLLFVEWCADFCPGWKRKAFFGENAFFRKLRTRPKEALCGFLEKSVFAKKLEAYSRIKAQTRRCEFNTKLLQLQ